jgi:hypothetical protein
MRIQIRHPDTDAAQSVKANGAKDRRSAAYSHRVVSLYTDYWVRLKSVELVKSIYRILFDGRGHLLFCPGPDRLLFS